MTIEDPCLCSHDLTDHATEGKSPCDIHGCRCDEFEADGDGYDPERDA